MAWTSHTEPDRDEALTQHEQLLQQVNAQLSKSARFVPAAFHVHSIESHDWAAEATGERDQRSLYEGDAGMDAFLDELAARARIVCITDHMRCSYACALASRAAARDDITVLPGMEVNVLVGPGYGDRVHLLVVFPPDKTPGEIERIFAGTDIPAEEKRTGQEEIRLSNLREWREAVRAEGGLFVVAHVDQIKRGHRAYYRAMREDTLQVAVLDDEGKQVSQQVVNEYANVLVDIEPDAIEVMKPGDEIHYATVTTTDGKRGHFACVARSDHHSITDLDRPDRMTHVKVSAATYGQVQSALRFFRTRVRLADDLPPSPAPALVGVRIRSADDGLFRDCLIAFNENLNCLIGPRGSGKSTVVEALRYVLGQNALLERDGEEGAYARLSRDLQEANLKDTEIELLYRDSEGVHVLAATFDAEETTTSVYTLSGEDCNVAAEALPERFPVQIYSWSEIETLGRKSELQRELIDRLTEAMAGLRASRDEIRDELENVTLELRRRREDLARQLAADDGLIRRYTEYKTTFERLNTPEVAALFKEADELRERLTLITVATEELESFVQVIDDLVGDVADPFEPVLDEVSEAVVEWWRAEIAPALVSLPAEASAELVKAKDAVSLRLQLLYDQRRATEEALGKVEAAVREQTQADAQEAVRRDQREEARRRFRAVEARRREYLEAVQELEELLTVRSATLERLAEVTEAISVARAQSAVNLADGLEGLAQSELVVTVELDPLGDRMRLVAFLDDRFLTQERAGQYHAQRTAKRLAALGTPAQIAAALMNGDREFLAGDGTDAEGLRAAEIDRLLGALVWTYEDPDADVRVFTPVLDELLALGAQPIDDTVQICLNGEPVNDLSPGQRSSAMLPLIALAESVPLVIDQPEDNLDNRMVASTLRRVLAELKERRQIIVCTHNPNIVVGGDAEQVVVLEPDAGRKARVDRTGSIDDEGVVDAVIGIMEGGAEAFRERGRRYGERLDEVRAAVP